MEQDPHETAEIDLRSDPKKTKDQGGRRKKADRRGRTTADKFPERRWLRHRRDGGDRRSFRFSAPVRTANAAMPSRKRNLGIKGTKNEPSTPVRNCRASDAHRKTQAILFGRVLREKSM